MKVSGFNEAVAIAIANDQSYRPEAYQFVRESLESTLKKKAKSKAARSSRQGADQAAPTSHVTAGELLEGFRLQALREFGPMAVTVLEYWGITTSRDIGKLVFNLVEAGAFGRTENDSIEDFEKGLDFHEAFVAPFHPHPAPDVRGVSTSSGSAAAESLPLS